MKVDTLWFRVKYIGPENFGEDSHLVNFCSLISMVSNLEDDDKLEIVPYNPVFD